MDTSDKPSSDALTPLRVVTWNLNHWRQPLLPTDTRAAAWTYLTDTLGAHVALVQEAVPPDRLARTQTVYGEMADYRDWGSAVVALAPNLELEPLRSVRMPHSRRRYLLANTQSGSVAIALLTVPGAQAITLVSVYGVFDGSPVSSMHRVIADLIPLFDSPHGARVILGGDFNVSRATTDPKYLARSEAVLAGIRSLGLVEAKALKPDGLEASPDCPCGTGGSCDHLPTWGSAELDHVFVSPSLADQVRSLQLDTSAVPAGLSDHAPLVLDLALSAERTAQVWDEESFAHEIGRRHGAGARDVVARLVNWAEHKERALARESGVRDRTLTRFPTNGTTTDPELWFTLDLDLEPRGSQSALCIRADGKAVVPFGSMRHPPFDTVEARDELRQALNTMEGVHIKSHRLKYWPTFSISHLEDPENLATLVSVLDRIATETHAAPPKVAAPEEVPA